MKKLLLSMVAVAGCSAFAFAGDGTAASPYTVSEVIALGKEGSTANTYVEGYIVGTCPGKNFNSATFTADGASNTNILLADASAEDDYTMTIPVQLPSGSIRNDLNLQVHPKNLGHKVLICGTRTAYFGAPGIKDTSSYSWIGDAPVDDPVEELGTKESPITVSELKAAAPMGNVTWLGGYIVGYVPGQNFNETVFGTTGEPSNTNLVIAGTADEKDYNLCVPVQLPAGASRDELSLLNHPENLGKYVILCGTHENYFGVSALKNVSEWVLDGTQGGNQGGGSTSNGNIIYNKDVKSTDCGFTFENNELEGGKYVWSIDSKYGLKASSYISSVGYVADAYAVSPVLDMTNFTAPIEMNFNQAGNYFKGTFLDAVSVVAREEGATTWEKVDGLVAPASDSWAFSAVEPLNLDKYAGKKIQVAFHYTADGTTCGTWEIDNLVITGTNNSAVAGIEAEEGVAVWFDLQGRAVANPENGLYIKVQNGKATKVVIR